MVNRQLLIFAVLLPWSKPVIQSREQILFNNFEKLADFPHRSFFDRLEPNYASNTWAHVAVAHGGAVEYPAICRFALLSSDKQHWTSSVIPILWALRPSISRAELASSTASHFVSIVANCTELWLNLKFHHNTLCIPSALSALASNTGNIYAISNRSSIFLSNYRREQDHLVGFFRSMLTSLNTLRSSCLLTTPSPLRSAALTNCLIS